MKAMTIASVKVEHVEAYVYATEEHRARPDWEDIMEKVYPMAFRAVERLELCDDITDEQAVEDCLISAGPELQAEIFENILKHEAIVQ